MAINPTGAETEVVAPRISAGGHFTVAFTFTDRKQRQDMSDQEYGDLLADIVQHAVHDRYPDLMIQRLEQDENKDGFEVWG